MNSFKTYQTKAKWVLGHNKGVPVGGYYSRTGPQIYFGQTAEVYDAGVNVLMEGKLVQTGTGRGRSAAYLCVNDMDSATSWTMSMDGINNLMHAIALGEVTVTYDGYYPVLTGFWTFAKRGTEVSIIPAPHALWD